MSKRDISLRVVRVRVRLAMSDAKSGAVVANARAPPTCLSSSSGSQFECPGGFPRYGKRGRSLLRESR